MFDDTSSLDSSAFPIGSDSFELRGLRSNLNRKNADEVHFDQPPSLENVRNNITNYLYLIHKRLGALAGPEVEADDIWKEFFEVTKSTLISWDDENRNRFPLPRRDGSIFVSLGTYRDPYCPMTLKSLYSQASSPRKVFVGLFQQNCFEKVCRTGVLQGGKMEDTGADVNCYEEFCKSPEGQKSGACDGNIRLFNVNESESLGPYMARYFGSKFYRGEQYYLQIDSHSEFVESWDQKLIKMVTDAPARMPIISTYPPDSTMNWRNTPGFRMCDSEFATSQIEWQIIRLSPSRSYESKPRNEPAYAPFVAAGFLFGPAQLLHDVPFDPLLPWIFMGEEISMSARLWTSGYDIFAPTINVLNHYYVRRHYPKFWESVNRYPHFSLSLSLLKMNFSYFKKPIHNEVTSLVIKRVKFMLGYVESPAETISPPSLIHRSATFLPSIVRHCFLGSQIGPWEGRDLSSRTWRWSALIRFPKRLLRINGATVEFGLHKRRCIE
jgi:[Skp1-protein]-hydroxyproline N-acetylglucosaminyltransferase